MKITDVALILSTPKMGSTTVAILCLSCEAGMTMTEIARAVGMTGAAITGSADQLEKLGLVERKSSVKDRRSFHLTATMAGKMLVNQMQRKLDDLAKAESPLPASPAELA